MGQWASLQPWYILSQGLMASIVYSVSRPHGNPGIFCLKASWQPWYILSQVSNLQPHRKGAKPYRGRKCGNIFSQKFWLYEVRRRYKVNLLLTSHNTTSDPILKFETRKGRQNYKKYVFFQNLFAKVFF